MSKVSRGTGGYRWADEGEAGRVCCTEADAEVVVETEETEAVGSNEGTKEEAVCTEIADMEAEGTSGADELDREGESAKGRGALVENDCSTCRD